MPAFQLRDFVFRSYYRQIMGKPKTGRQSAERDSGGCKEARFGDGESWKQQLKGAKRLFSRAEGTDR